jgi:hypothetical protein
MKEIKNERTVYDIVYEAVDGTQFPDREQCKLYEKTARCTVYARFEKLIIEKGDECTIFGVGCEDSKIFAVKIASTEDVDTVMQLYLLDNAWLLQDDNSDFRDKSYAKILKAYKTDGILFVGMDCEDNIYIIDARETVLERLNNIGEEKDDTVQSE